MPESEKVQAKEQFQKIAFAYAILSEPRRRRRYDSTGSTAETLDVDDDDFDWLSFFREQWKEVITPEKISEDKREYEESGEQRAALLAAYTKYKGDMTHVYQVVMHSNVLEDDARFREILDEAIATKEVAAFDKYTKETEKSKQNRIAAAKRQAKEWEESQKANGATTKHGKLAKGDADLAALIQAKQGKSSRFLEHLEEKYGGGGSSGKGNGKTRKRDEPPEEAFAATAARGKKSKSSK